MRGHSCAKGINIMVICLGTSWFHQFLGYSTMSSPLFSLGKVKRANRWMRAIITSREQTRRARKRNSFPVRRVSPRVTMMACVRVFLRYSGVLIPTLVNLSCNSLVCKRLPIRSEHLPWLGIVVYNKGISIDLSEISGKPVNELFETRLIFFRQSRRST